MAEAVKCLRGVIILERSQRSASVTENVCFILVHFMETRLAPMDI
jgi:hypothetical protein